MNNKLITISYLACPFSHSDPEVQLKRHSIVNQVTYAFHQKGKLVYSPLTHNIPLKQLDKQSSGWGIWEKFDRAMLMRCDELIVLKLSGWKESIGVMAEISFAKELNLPIQMIEPESHIF